MTNKDQQNKSFQLIPQESKTLLIKTKSTLSKDFEEQQKRIQEYDEQIKKKLSRVLHPEERIKKIKKKLTKETVEEKIENYFKTESKIKNDVSTKKTVERPLNRIKKKDSLKMCEGKPTNTWKNPKLPIITEDRTNRKPINYNRKISDCGLKKHSLTYNVDSSPIEITDTVDKVLISALSTATREAIKSHSSSIVTHLLPEALEEMVEEYLETAIDKFTTEWESCIDEIIENIYQDELN